MNAQQKSFALLLLVLAIFLYSCKSGADNPKEASEQLVQTTNWFIHEIWVNDVLTFSEGKMKPQFGGIDFDRYMENIRFEKDGAFTGYFKGDSKPIFLKWEISGDNVIVRSLDSSPKGGEWTISPKDVFEDSFTMKTQSSAYDFPRVTKIALKFKTEN